MPLTLRHVTGHPQAQHAYRIVYEGREIGSIGLQIGSTDRGNFWAWGLDTVLPPPGFLTSGQAESRDEAMAAFRAMWDRYAADEGRLAEFLAGYRKADAGIVERIALEIEPNPPKPEGPPREDV